MTKGLSGKVAIITGGANGIGRATAELFVEQGAKVVIADLDEQGGGQLARELGNAARFHRTDVSKDDEIQQLVDFAVSAFGGLNIMFNNAGLPDNYFGDFLDNDLSNFQSVIDVNLRGVMLGTIRAARHMAKHGGGSIINTSSIAATRAGHGFVSYRVAKAGVVNFTQTAAVELGIHLIRVNCICPGNVPTNMAKQATPEQGMTQATADRIRAAYNAVRMTRQPLKRQSSTLDVAQAALFLGGDHSQHVSGLIMPVDGAATAGDPIYLIPEIERARAEAIAQGD